MNVFFVYARRNRPVHRSRVEVLKNGVTSYYFSCKTRVKCARIDAATISGLVRPQAPRIQEKLKTSEAAILSMAHFDIHEFEKRECIESVYDQLTNQLFR